MRCRSCTRSCNLLKALAAGHCPAPVGWEGAKGRREPEDLPWKLYAFGIKSEGFRPDFYSPVSREKWGMKRYFVFLAFLAITTGGLHAADRIRVLRYEPAPGQFINLPGLGTPDAARRMAAMPGNLVSLGAFGGSILLAVDPPLQNDSRNPYGIDFTLFGNAFEGSAEPGIVWVMKDENGNGLPDDGWYQIAGSSCFDPATRQNHRITWFHSSDSTVAWNDNLGNSGMFAGNPYHRQPYYPEAALFPGYAADSLTLTGTLLPVASSVQAAMPGQPTLPFGYADNGMANPDINPGNPDNPYTLQVREGAGGDPIDISWAVDDQGHYVDLDQVHFVRIVTGVFSVSGELGELSTEISSLVPTVPDGATGPEELTLFFSHPATLLAGDSLQLHAAFFRKGRIRPDTVLFSCGKESPVEVSPTGMVLAHRGGEAVIYAHPVSQPRFETCTRITVRMPDSLLCPDLRLHLSPGDTNTWRPLLLDQSGEEIAAMEWSAWIRDSSVASLKPAGGGFTIFARAPGNTLLTLLPLKYPSLAKQFTLSVSPAPVAARVYGTAKTSVRNLLPFQWLGIQPAPLNGLVEKRNGNYDNRSFVSLAHAAAGLLARAGALFNFREHDSGSGLYLYSVVNQDLYTYGWGGATDPPAYAKAWIVRKNNSHHISGLEKIPVENGDTVMVYHVNSILKDWQLTLLTSTPDSAMAGDWLSVRARAVTCRQEGGLISESVPFDLESQPVWCSDGKGSPLLTDSRGFALLEVNRTPPLVVTSGNDGVLIKPATLAPAALHDTGQPSLFPNPANDILHISAPGNRRMGVSVCDLAGRVLLQTRAVDFRSGISIRTLCPGIYIALIQGDKTSFVAKFRKE